MPLIQFVTCLETFLGIYKKQTKYKYLISNNIYSSRLLSQTVVICSDMYVSTTLHCPLLYRRAFALACPSDSFDTIEQLNDKRTIDIKRR